ILSQNRQAYAPLDAIVSILDAPSTNAFTFPHGEIFVHTGMLGRLRNEAQLAMLLGHEITHATNRHTFQEHQDLYARRGASAYIGVISALGGGNVHDAVSGLGTLLTLAAVTGYSREKESEADRTGMLLMAQAGYRPSQGPEMFERMLAAADRAERHR